jgi:signal transduction histidine kinase
VIGFSEILHEDLTAGGETRMAQDALRIRNAARHLLGLIDQVLDFSRVEDGAMVAVLAPADLPGLVGAAVAAMRRQAEAKGLTLSVDCGSAPSEIVTDEAKLRQCLDALLANACKFTHKGAIDVYARRVGGDWVEISVSDTGIGIPPETQRRLFAPFGQGDGSATRQYGGLGLGLAMARRIAQLLGGSITLTSAPGDGTTIVVRLPLVAAEERQAA